MQAAAEANHSANECSAHGRFLICFDCTYATNPLATATAAYITAYPEHNQSAAETASGRKILANSHTLLLARSLRQPPPDLLGLADDDLHLVAGEGLVRIISGVGVVGPCCQHCDVVDHGRARLPRHII